MNKNLHTVKHNKNDEFYTHYTQLVDIEKELLKKVGNKTTIYDKNWTKTGHSIRKQRSTAKQPLRKPGNTF